jgi:hypothetical protein
MQRSRPPELGPRAQAPGDAPAVRLSAAPFALGLAIGAILGSAFFLGLSAPERVRIEQAGTRSGALADLGSSAFSTWEKSVAPNTDGSLVPALELTIRRGDSGDAQFPLRLAATPATENGRMVLRNLPSSVSLSHGERRDDRTWVLSLADLDHLGVKLGEGAPGAFDVSIEMTSETGARLGRAIARVRLAQDPVAASTATSGADPNVNQSAATPAPPVAPREASPPAQAAAPLPPFQTDVVAVPPQPTGQGRDQVAPASPSQSDASRSAAVDRPPGSSALGGPAGDQPPSAEPPRRLLWWKMPAPQPGSAPSTGEQSRH